MVVNPFLIHDKAHAGPPFTDDVGDDAGLYALFQGMRGGQVKVSRRADHFIRRIHILSATIIKARKPAEYIPAR